MTKPNSTLPAPRPTWRFIRESQSRLYTRLTMLNEMTHAELRRELHVLGLSTYPPTTPIALVRSVLVYEAIQSAFQAHSSRELRPTYPNDL